MIYYISIARLYCLGLCPDLCVPQAVRDLAAPGDLGAPQAFPFEFANVEMQYDSYKGSMARLRWGSLLVI